MADLRVLRLGQGHQVYLCKHVVAPAIPIDELLKLVVDGIYRTAVVRCSFLFWLHAIKAMVEIIAEGAPHRAVQLKSNAESL